MSKLTILGGIAVLFSVMGLAIAESNDRLAQERAGTTPHAGTNQHHQEYEAHYRGQAKKAVASKTHRASEIIGLNVMTPGEESIGEVEDLVLDAENGKVRYAAVSVGGLLGIGDKLVAVPWQAFRCNQDEDGNATLTLSTTREKLKNAPGFDQDNWPNFADKKWSNENDRHYEVNADFELNEKSEH